MSKSGTPIFVGLVLGLWASLVFAEEIVPKVSIPEPEYNFGLVHQGDIVKRSFVVNNSGKGTLQILRVVPSCGCTAAVAKSSTLGPGDSTTVDVEFDTRGFSGEKEKSIRIVTNDPDSPITVLNLKGQIGVDVNLEPQRLFFGEVNKNQTVERSFKISIRKESPVKIASIKAYSPRIELQESGDDKNRNVIVRLKASSEVGEFRDRVVISLFNDPRKAINLPVFAKVMGSLRMEPDVLSFGIVEGTKPLTREVRLLNRSKASIVVTSKKATHPALSLETVEIKAGQEFLLKVKLDPTKMKSNLKAAIVVSTNAPDEKDLNLEVYGILPPDEKD